MTDDARVIRWLPVDYRRISVINTPGNAVRRGPVMPCALLSIPHLIALYVPSFVGEVITALGWIAALFIGLPNLVANYLSGLVRWQGRQLNRLAVLFRSLLMVRTPCIRLWARRSAITSACAQH
jgi:hypothetical protein